MRTGAAAHHHGYLHEAVLYGSEAELLDVAVPFLRGGIAAGEPTLVGFGLDHAGLVRAAMPAEPVVFLDGGDMYARPASAITAYRQLLAGYVAAGARQIRIIGELAPTDFGATWGWWARYESAINQLYDDFPLWSMCAYDRRTTPGHVMADVLRTHPRIAGPGDRSEMSTGYVSPEAFLTAGRTYEDPILRDLPLLTLTDAPLAEIRRAVVDANTVGLPAEAMDRLKVAVNEIATNAVNHGQPPVEVCLWAGDGRIVVAVTNKGGPPTDPYAGLRPAAHAPQGGLGLWLVHQLCDYVHFDRGAAGFTVTMAVGAIR